MWIPTSCHFWRGQYSKKPQTQTHAHLKELSNYFKLWKATVTAWHALKQLFPNTLHLFFQDQHTKHGDIWIFQGQHGYGYKLNSKAMFCSAEGQACLGTTSSWLWHKHKAKTESKSDTSGCGENFENSQALSMLSLCKYLMLHAEKSFHK